MITGVEDFERYKLAEYDYWQIYLHQSQVYLGRSYLALKRQGDLDPFLDTTQEEQEEFLVAYGGLVACLDKLYQPDKTNLANLRNVWAHCHWHVIPRYQSPREVAGQTFEDQNWGSPYYPYDRAFTIPENVMQTIITDMKAELAA